MAFLLIRKWQHALHETFGSEFTSFGRRKAFSTLLSPSLRRCCSLMCMACIVPPACLPCRPSVPASHAYRPPCLLPDTRHRRPLRPLRLNPPQWPCRRPRELERAIAGILRCKSSFCWSPIPAGGRSARARTTALGRKRRKRLLTVVEEVKRRGERGGKESGESCHRVQRR